MTGSSGVDGQGEWDVASIEPPWRGRPSIHAHVVAHVWPGVVGLADGAERLPDDKDDGHGRLRRRSAGGRALPAPHR